ncbi:hypothetical protein Enr17x_53660 [Gimesia fumaroli]|uniref:Uncharacterized protein n=1 Tax=Gimesia fumaroli TaxID=2527976 RepID=A0A518IJM0_9PLAN|nr:hypothetical protein Enr17x_53660 [Gimesia fumaroli]
MNSRGCLSHNCFKPRVESKQLIFTDPLTEKELAFKLMIQPYGWCGPLIGHTLDGSPFPLKWEFNGLNSHNQSSNILDLPKLADQDEGIKRLEN